MKPQSVIPRQLKSSGFEKCSGRYASPPVPLYSFSPSGMTVIVLSFCTADTSTLSVVVNRLLPPRSVSHMAAGFDHRAKTQLYIMYMGPVYSMTAITSSLLSLTSKPFFANCLLIQRSLSSTDTMMRPCSMCSGGGACPLTTTPHSAFAVVVMP